MNRKLLSVITLTILLNTSFCFAAANFTAEPQQNVYQQQYAPYGYQNTPYGYQNTQYNQNNQYNQYNNQYNQYPSSQESNTYETQYPLPNYQGQQYPAQYTQPLQGNVVMVPAGTTFGATTTSSLSSSTAALGEAVSWVLGSDFYYGGKLIAPAGSRINGTVTVLRKAGRTGKNGQLGIRFTSLLTPMGQMIPISAVIQTDDGTGVLYAAAAKDTTKEYVKDTAIGAGAGAALGTAMGALAGGSVGRGAIYGTAIGAGLGVGKALLYKGQEVEVPANVQLQIKIDQPITINSNTIF